MIESIKELLCKIKENKLEDIADFLNNNKINHRPTNGDMYEMTLLKIRIKRIRKCHLI